VIELSWSDKVMTGATLVADGGMTAEL